MRKLNLTTKNFIFDLAKPILLPPPPSSSFYICRHIWKEGDVVTEERKEKGRSEINSNNGRRETESAAVYEKEAKDRATETAQEAWKAIEEAAAEMNHRVVPNLDANKETDIRDEMLIRQQQHGQ
ncbi:unnamed protein product [Cuscuta campestris]|uniref:Uncharacterized protein n=2 Tax=Cuscuta sect. Cleistogrammica TaxID=1824901 RepID=A0A484MJ42_9ASTE|nr:hypothetical protein DM860_001960 [Cuscuta australis]VFQ88539.1 unnamed protein product [Cuscuta campestris]